MPLMGFFNRKRRDEPESTEPAPSLEEARAANPVFDAIAGQLELVQAVPAHITRHFGQPLRVLSPTTAEEGIEMYIMPPSEERPWFNVITAGMSHRPMPGAPAGSERIELLIALPPEWPLELSDFSDENNWWPLRLLHNLAHIPWAQDTWLGTVQTIPHGEPYADNTSFCGCKLLAPALAPDGFFELEVGAEKVHFYGVRVLYADELAYAREHTGWETHEYLTKGKAFEIVQLDRPSAG